MAAPKFRPAPTTERTRAYQSPDHVPEGWTPERPGQVEGFQPSAPRLGSQGPDQGFALRVAAQLRDQIQLQRGENADDVIRGCLGVALRRASIYSRAPVVHDLTIAFTLWGFFDPDPDVELVAARGVLFEGLRHVGHHYMEARALADVVPDRVLRMTPDQVSAAYSSDWRAQLDL